MRREPLELRTPGFAAHAPAVGFASLMGTKTAPKPTETTRPTPRAKRYNAPKPQYETYPWPEMAVVRRINMPEAGKHWKSIEAKIAHTARNIGRSVGLRNFQCEIITQAELHNAMDERFSSVSRDKDTRRRNRVARDFADDINGIIEDLEKDEHQRILANGLAETADLRERAQDPDNPKWFAYMIEAVTGDELTDERPEPEQLWSPRLFGVGPQEGCGPQGIGVVLQDEKMVLPESKRILVGAMCSSLGVNPIHFGDMETPSVKMIDTVLPVDGLRYNLPALYPDLALKSPRAYIDRPL